MSLQGLELIENRYWEREPCKFSLPGEPLLTEREVLACLVEVADEYRAGLRDPIHARRNAEHARLRFYVDRGAHMAGIDAALPDAGDVTLDAYLARAAHAFSGRDIELIVNQFQSYSFPLWLRLREMLTPLYARVGVPADQAEAVLFLRDHRVGLGLHRDAAGV